MKLTTVLLLATCLQVSARAVSQTVTLRLSNAPFEKTLKDIAAQTGYELFYRLEQMKEAKSVSIEVNKAELKSVLDVIFSNQPFTYAIANRTIILSPRPRPVPASPPLDTLPLPSELKGKVLSENGAPVAGATVYIKGAAGMHLTNSNGDVLLKRPANNATLVISSIGYEPQEFQLKINQASFTIHLKVRITELSAMEVNNGMFTRNRSSFTGAATTYTGDQLKTIGNRNVLESLKTLDPTFVQITNNNQGSNPNTMPTFEIRGRTSISTTDLNDQFSSDPNQPLFILDGFESTLQAIYDLDMNRVLSVTILKDAASTALYGAKASNGVIVVETKRPLPGELRVSYSGDFSLDMPDLRSYNLMNAAEKLKFEKLSGIYNNDPNSQWLSDQRYNQRLTAVQQGVNTYWLSEPVHLGVSNRHSLQLSGGTNSLLFNAGASYGNQDGIIKGSGRQNWSGNFTTSYRKGRVNVNDMFSMSGTTATSSPYGDFSLFAGANPYYKKRNADGTIPEYLDKSDVTIVNPLYTATLNSLNQTKSFGFYNNLAAIINLAAGLRLQGAFQLSKGNTTQLVFDPPEDPKFDNTDYHQKGSYNNNHSDNTGYSGNIMLSYAKVIDRHQFTVNTRADLQQTAANSVGFSAVGFPYGTNGNPSYSFSYTPYTTPSASSARSHSVGFLGSLNYAYDQRFLLDATYRLDGASVFGSNRQFKPFASAGLGWNISKEHFLRQYRWIDLLKIRGDVGYTGNENLGQFSSVSIYSIQPGLNNFGQGLELSSLGNANLAWQKTLQQSYGTDFAFLHNRISGYAEYFIKRTDPLAIGANGTLPSSVGVNGNYVMNIGRLLTKGWDFNLRVSPVYNLKKRIIWTLGITGSAYNSQYGGLGNSLAALNKAEQSSNGLIRYQDGYSPDDAWAVISKGIDPATGNELFLKKDGTLTFTYDPNDIVRVGNTRPKIEGVVNTSFTYQNFTLGANLRYSYGGYMFNSAIYDKVENISFANVHNNQDRRALYERWQKPGDVAQFKSIANTSSTPMSSRFIEKNNYFDGESFSLGYRVSNGWVRRLSMQTLNFTAYLNNIFWLETIKTERGINYPFDRTISFSVSASF
jgi:TonB-linked SusC/RagA family outer membrane protein